MFALTERERHIIQNAFVAAGEADYPQRLQMIDDAPPLVALRGNQRAPAY